MIGSSWDGCYIRSRSVVSPVVVPPNGQRESPCRVAHGWHLLDRAGHQVNQQACLGTGTAHPCSGSIGDDPCSGSIPLRTLQGQTDRAQVLSGPAGHLSS
jgi:hypothetical protein